MAWGGLESLLCCLFLPSSFWAELLTLSDASLKTGTNMPSWEGPFLQGSLTYRVFLTLLPTACLEKRGHNAAALPGVSKPRTPHGDQTKRKTKSQGAEPLSQASAFHGDRE